MTLTGWLMKLNYNPVSTLSSSKNIVVTYFTKRDLLDKNVKTIDYVWQLPEVQKILQDQKADGSWSYSGRKKKVYPEHHYKLLQTWKKLRILVKHYGLTQEHTAARDASEYLFSCQTEKGDIRGMIGNQYATYYTGAMLAVLIKAGYEDDPRVEKGIKWLLSVRQDDGGWTIPILTHKLSRETQNRLSSEYSEPVEPDRSKPYSHNWTDMVLRAFAAHPKYYRCEEALKAAELLKSRFFKPDVYSSYRAASYWVRFMFWWPNIVTSLDSLSLMGYSQDDPDIKKGLNWLIRNQQPNGLWKTTYVKGKKELLNERTMERRLWLTLEICRIFRRFYN